MMQAQQPVITCPYITDGLIFWLDGIDVSSDSLWVEKIGNRQFALYNCVKTQYGVSFDGSTSYGICSSADFDGETIEGAYTLNSTSASQAIFTQRSIRTDQKIILARTSAGTIYTRATDTNVAQRKYDLSLIETVSAYQDGSEAIVNGNTTIQVTGNKSEYNTSGSLYIGKQPTSTNWMLNGTLHSVRVYSRKLTEAEMLYNQGIDNTRFNLGVLS